MPKYNNQNNLNNEQVSVSAQKKESGELSILQREFGLPSHLSNWMDYYACHLEHPDASYCEISYHFHVTKSTIDRAIHFMNQALN